MTDDYIPPLNQLDNSATSKGANFTQGYSKLLGRLDERASVARSEGTGTVLGDALHFEQAATAIRALVEESGRLREALGVLTACASSDDAFGLDDALSNARAALGETE
jgi:hypothetical protein